jgi:putative membrane protein
MGLTGHSLDAMLGFQRNHYDRLMHFLYGLLVTPAAVELFAHYGRFPRAWAALFPMLFVASHSVIYELVEWGAAAAFGGDLGQAYLGTQGDVWDAQKDMALAFLGTIVAIAALGLARRLPVRGH